jgi:hypothetical protein
MMVDLSFQTPGDLPIWGHYKRLAIGEQPGCGVAFNLSGVSANSVGKHYAFVEGTYGASRVLAEYEVSRNRHGQAVRRRTRCKKLGHSQWSGSQRLEH